MRHFDQLDSDAQRLLFHRVPQSFDRGSDRELLAKALGATLYVPATANGLILTVRRQAASGAKSMVIDLEDAVPDVAVDAAMTAIVQALCDFVGDPPESQIFVRVRSADQIRKLAKSMGQDIGIVSGFVMPKFSASGGRDYLHALVDAADQTSYPVYAMPVLETPAVLYRESRDAELMGIRRLLDEYRDRVLAIRIGATDLCGLFGIRRDRDLSIYDVGVAADFIAQAVNHLGRHDGTGFPITGPVWEYFANHERILRPQLRQSPFEQRDATGLRRRLLSRDLDGLIRETMLDRANGLSGKTVIHPLHLAPVHALAVVPHEEHQDAVDILHPDAAGGGVRRSEYRNKMNEVRPHRSWAERTMLRAKVFGVAQPGVTHVDLLNALWETA